MSFSQDELDSAIEKIVKTNIRREYDVLGTRRMDRTFNDLQDAAAGIFLLFANAPFYVVRLSADRLAGAASSEVSLLDEFSTAVEVTNRQVTGVRSLSPLANARTALDALAQATAARSTGFKSIEDIPAFQRFDRNTQRFLDESGKNIRDNGEVAQTPDEARLLLPSLFRQLEAAHSDVLRRAQLLASALQDFEALNLPGLLSRSVIENSRDVLAARFDELASLPEQERLAVVRDVTLDVLATRAAVRGFGTLQTPTIFLLIEGSGSVFADDDHPATPAFLLSDRSGPYNILSDRNELDFTLDGDVSTTITVPIQGSFVPTIEATNPEPFDIDATNNQLRLQLKNYPSVGSTTTIDTAFSLDATKPIWDVVDELNLAILGATPLIAEAYANPRKFSGAVNIDVTGSPNDADFVSLNPSTDFLFLGIEAGDRVIVRDATSAHNNYIYEVVTVATTTLSCTILNPALPAGDETGKNIEVGTDVLALRLRITGPDEVPDYREQALIDRVSIFVPETGPTTEEEQFAASTTLGLFPLMDAVARPTTAQEVVRTFNASPFNGLGTGARVEAKAFFSAVHYTGLGRTDPFDFLKVVVSKFLGSGSMTGGTTVTFSVTGAQTAGVSVGDKVVLRATFDVSDVGTVGTVTAVSDTSISATMSSSVTAAAVTVEAGPDLSTIGFDATVRLSEGGNAGDYRVTGVGVVPFELSIDFPLPFPAGLGNVPIELLVSVGRFFVEFDSLDETIATAITMDDGGNPRSAVGEFFLSPPESAVGTTPFFQLPEFSKSLEEGDLLELYAAQFNSPSTTASVVGLESSLRLIETSPELPIDTPAFSFTPGTPVPFARIRKKRLNNYQVFRDALETWLARDENDEVFLAELDRLLHPLLVNTNPTLSQVNDVKLKLQEIGGALADLSTILASYEADVVIEVDVLVQSFVEKGADRAAALLLEGRFSDFFGLDQDETSYAGSVQKAIKDVTRSDLPIRKTNRVGRFASTSQTIASFDQTDFEFDQRDIDDVTEPDIPVGISGVEFPGSSFLK